MEMPSLTDDHRQLAKLAGIWKGDETMYPSQWDPKGGKAEASTRARVALNGFAVVGDYEQMRDGKRTFEGHGIYTFDARQKQVVLHWFDSMGHGREEFRGGWKGDVLTLTSKTPMGHARLIYDCSTAGMMRSSMEMSPDGSNWSKFFDANYKRAD